MRVITGKYKGRHFDVPRGFKARPTTDFAKENLFNVLRSYLDFEEITAVDLFAGTGSISLELLSRGCPRVVSVERDRLHFSHLSRLFSSLKDEAAHPICTDALRFIERAKEEFDFVFADPPYALSELAELPRRIFSSSLVKEGGLVVIEHGKEHDFSQASYFVEHRAYGSVNFSFFQKPMAANQEQREEE